MLGGTARGNEAHRSALISETLEERDGLWLRSEKQLASGRDSQRRLHESVTEASPLVGRRDEDFTHTREEISVRQNANGADKGISIPSPDVVASFEGSIDLDEIVLARPYLLGKRDECLGGESRIVSPDTGHARSVMVNLRGPAVGAFGHPRSWSASDSTVLHRPGGVYRQPLANVAASRSASARLNPSI